MPLPTLRVLLLLLLCTVSLAAACADGQDAAPSEDTAAAPPAAAVDGDEGGQDGQAAEDTEPPALAIVTTNAPMADVLSRLVGDRGSVQALVPPGMDSHTYEPRPGDVATVSRADAFIDTGLDLNPAAVALAEANLPEDEIGRAHV